MKNWHYLLKLNVYLPPNPEIPLLRTYPTESEYITKNNICQNWLKKKSENINKSEIKWAGKNSPFKENNRTHVLLPLSPNIQVASNSNILKTIPGKEKPEKKIVCNLRTKTKS